MKKPNLLKCLCFACLAIMLSCVCNSAEPRILIVGDSWAQTIGALGLMDKALAQAGFDNICSVGEPCALGGTRAAQWVTPEYGRKIKETLDAHPTVDMIHLVIGGNDVLRRIKEQNVFEVWTEEERAREWDAVARHIKRIVLYCLACEQVRHVVIAGYDYLNAATAQEVFALLGQNFQFGGMTQAQVNQCFIEHERRKRDLALEIEGCAYIHNLGLMQHHFGAPPGAPKPGGPPDYAPFPGGAPAMPMPDAAFTPVNIAGKEYPGDGIHPNEEAHLVMLGNAINVVYKPFLQTSAPSATAAAQ